MDTKLYVCRDNKTLIVTAGNKVVADTYSDDFSRSEQIDRAAFIVRAVNSHDQLVAALKFAVKIIDENGLCMDDSEGYEQACAALAAAGAA